MLQIPEAAAYPELGAFLTRINAPGFPLATAKCDAWFSREISPEEEIFGDCKFVSYIDLVFVEENARYSLEKHEEFAKELCRLLGHAPDIAATVEIVIRRCYYHPERFVCAEETEQAAEAVSLAIDDEMAGPEPESDGSDAIGREIGGHERESVGREEISRETAGHEHESDGREAASREINEPEQDRVEGAAESCHEIVRPEQVSARIEGDSQSGTGRRFHGREGQAAHQGPLANGCSDETPTLDSLGASVGGFCWTAYVTGFGDQEHEPHRRWEIALTLLQLALVQLTSS